MEPFILLGACDNFLPICGSLVERPQFDVGKLLKHIGQAHNVSFPKWVEIWHMACHGPKLIYEFCLIRGYSV